LWYNATTMLSTGSIVGVLDHKL